MDFNKKVLTLDEACEYLNLKKSYVYKLTSSGILPYSKPNGKFLYFEREKLDGWMLSMPNISYSEKQVKAATYITTSSNVVTQKNKKGKNNMIYSFR